MKKVITFKFNIVLYLFSIFHVVFLAGVMELFDDTLVQNKGISFISEIFKKSFLAGTIWVIIIFILSFIFMLIETFLLKKIWNDFLVEKIKIFNEIIFQEALTLIIIKSYLIAYVIQ